MAAQARAVREERAQLDKTVWAKEVQAQKYEETFVKLWDDLREQKDKYMARAARV